MELWQEIHRRASLEGRLSYVDPATGLSVFTEVYHKGRGYCCGSGCRHCPWRIEKESGALSEQSGAANIEPVRSDSDE